MDACFHSRWEVIDLHGVVIVSHKGNVPSCSILADLKAKSSLKCGMGKQTSRAAELSNQTNRNADEAPFSGDDTYIKGAGMLTGCANASTSGSRRY